jgi:hypothetical protein
LDLAVSTPASPLRIEGESLWPPLAQQGGWAWPTWHVPGCASHGKVLGVRGAPGASVRLAVPRGLAGSLRPLVLSGGEMFEITLEIDDATVARWLVPAGTERHCLALTPAALPGGPRRATLVLKGPEAALDALDLLENR